MDVSDILDEWARHYPEDDPFLQEALVIDEAIDDHHYNAAWFVTAETTLTDVAREHRRLVALRRQVELDTLDRWYALREPRPRPCPR